MDIYLFCYKFVFQFPPLFSYTRHLLFLICHLNIAITQIKLLFWNMLWASLNIQSPFQHWSLTVLLYSWPFWLNTRIKRTQIFISYVCNIWFRKNKHRAPKDVKMKQEYTKSVRNVFAKTSFTATGFSFTMIQPLMWQPCFCSLSEPIMFSRLAVCQACTSHRRAWPCLIGRAEAKQRLKLY